MTFLEDLTNLINRHSKENGSDTPDFLLAEYLDCQLRTWEQYVVRREQWYGRTQANSETGSVVATDAPTGDLG